MGILGKGEQLHEHELKGGSTSSVAVSVTPGTTAADVTFSLNDLPVSKMVDGIEQIAYLAFIAVDVTVTDDQAASGGSVVNMDKHGKIVEDIELHSDFLGTYRPERHNQGAALFLIDGPIANGYTPPQHAVAQTAAADGDTVNQLRWIIPIALGCFQQPEDFALPSALFRPGTLRVGGFVSTVMDGDSTGLVIETVTVRATAYYITKPEYVLGVPWQPRQYDPPAGDNPELTYVGQPQGIKGDLIDQSIAGLALHAFIAGGVTGTGLGGNDGIDNFTSLDCPALGIRDVKSPRNFFRSRLLAAGARRQWRSGIGTTIVHDLAGAPFYTMADTPSDPLSAQALAGYFLLPTDGQWTSKVKLVTPGQSIQHNFGVTTTLSAASRFRNWELLRWSQKAMSMVKNDVFKRPGWRWVPKLSEKQPAYVGGAARVSGRKIAFVPYKLVP